MTLTRYYSAGGTQLARWCAETGTVATLGDVQGSAQVAVSATDVTYTAYTPYGVKRAG